MTLLLLSGDQSARENEKEREREPKARGRALKPSHRLQVLPLCSAYRAQGFHADANEPRARFLQGQGRGGGNPNRLLAASCIIFKTERVARWEPGDEWGRATHRHGASARGERTALFYGGRGEGSAAPRAVPGATCGPRSEPGTRPRSRSPGAALSHFLLPSLFFPAPPTSPQAATVEASGSPRPASPSFAGTSPSEGRGAPSGSSSRSPPRVRSRSETELRRAQNGGRAHGRPTRVPGRPRGAAPTWKRSAPSPRESLLRASPGRDEARGPREDGAARAGERSGPRGPSRTPSYGPGSALLLRAAAPRPRGRRGHAAMPRGICGASDAGAAGHAGVRLPRRPAADRPPPPHAGRGPPSAPRTRRGRAAGVSGRGAARALPSGRTRDTCSRFHSPRRPGSADVYGARLGLPAAHPRGRRRTSALAAPRRAVRGEEPREAAPAGASPHVRSAGPLPRRPPPPAPRSRGARRGAGFGAGGAAGRERRWRGARGSPRLGAARPQEAPISMSQWRRRAVTGRAGQISPPGPADTKGTGRKGERRGAPIRSPGGRRHGSAPAARLPGPGPPHRYLPAALARRCADGAGSG